MSGEISDIDVNDNENYDEESSRCSTIAREDTSEPLGTSECGGSVVSDYEECELRSDRTTTPYSTSEGSSIGPPSVTQDVKNEITDNDEVFLVNTNDSDSNELKCGQSRRSTIITIHFCFISVLISF
jgi:hypothetical protein